MRHTSVSRCSVFAIVLACAFACNARTIEPKEDALDRRGDEDREGDGASLGAAGGAAMPSCATPSGRYQGAFELLGGDCGRFTNGDPMQLDNNITIEKFPDRDIETESTVDNCSLLLKQTVRDRTTGHVRSLMVGESLELDATATSATGRVSLQRFDEVGALACSGEYDVTLTKTRAADAP